ncbi:FAD_binding_3 domain-containing protein [Fusarium acuminatum]|uniref:FAD_binding_3 domain-containing protein n=1 Tax=Fusarium acuminatum TaxID=5515 RepID=A0ABZ2WX41_9HYPO
MAASERTVIIAGGSVAGLSLANMLEKAGIRYVLLEAHDDMTPQVGASIGLQAGGLRILDQIGCAEELMSLVDIPLNESYMRNPDGSVIKHHRRIQDQLVERHAYPTIFIDRQMLLKGLYDNLESKASIHPGQKVEKVTEVENGIQVTTAKGDVFKGDILVGADGIYSTVRREMWRLGNQSSPGYFPHDEWSNVPCYYKCIFGTSHPMEELTKGVHYVYNHNFSYLVMIGPGGRFYWFLFVKLPVPLYGKDIPRYTKDDEEKLVQEHASDKITPEVTFGQLYTARTISTLTPLHEYVFKKWHYKRIITIGDAAHKFEPLTGWGGNSAIETAATLVNHLISDIAPTWEISKIGAAFKAVQEERNERVQWLVDDAHKNQQMQAMATPLLAFVGPLLGLLDTSTALRISGNKNLAAGRVNSIPLPRREHSVPFNDELPARPLSLTWLPVGLGALTQGVLFRLSNKILLPLQIPTTFGGAPLLDHYTGVGIADKILSALVAVFSIPLASDHREANMQWIAFTPLLLSTTLDWTVESYRNGLKGLLTSFPSIFGAVYQLKGIGRIAPLYHLITVCEQFLHGSMRSVTGQAIDKEIVDSLIPSLSLGVILPTALMLWPFEDKSIYQKFVALWQLFPVYVSLLTAGISSVLRRQRAATTATAYQPKTPKERQEVRKQKEATHSMLRSVYMAGTATTALVHLWSLYRISSSSDLSFSGVFGRIGELVTGSYGSDTESRIFGFLQRDMFLNAASVFAHNLYRILHLRTSGYVTNREAVGASLALVVAQPVLGPAAAHIGLLGWREEVFMRISRRVSADN